MSCKYAKGNRCLIAERIASVKVTIRTDKACAVCLASPAPRAHNAVTTSLAIVSLRDSGDHDGAVKLLRESRPLREADTVRPSLIRRAVSWKQAIGRWKAAGSPVRSDEEVERILREHCELCEHYSPKWKQCKVCGCFCRAKGRAEVNKPKMATEICPLEPPKWGGERTTMDMVYPLASGRHGRKVLGSKWDNNELRYSIRSLEQNFPNLGRVFVVTETLPKWLKNVIHIPAKDTHRRNKDANLIDKVLLACKAGVSSIFVRLSDDQCLLRRWDGLHVWHRGRASRNARGSWWRRYQRTCKHLKAKGRTTYFYDCHCPASVDRDEFIRVAEDADYQSAPGMCINTLYFNSVDIPRERMNGQAVAFHSPTVLEDLRSKSRGKLFLGYNEQAMNDDIKRFLQERFPEPSRFEQ